MAVNESLWGNKNTWVTYANVLQHPANAVNSYALAYGLNTQSPNPEMHDKLDLSICPWGINAKSLLNQRYYIAPWYVDETYLCDLVPVNSNDLSKNKPLIINGIKRIINASGSEWSDAGILQGNSVLKDGYSPDFPYYSNIDYYTAWTNNNVVVNFDYSKIVLLPYIFCSAGNTITDNNIFGTSFSRYTFDEFLVSYDTDIKNKKIVKGFAWAEYFYSSNTHIRALNYASQLQFTIPYDVPKRPSYTDMNYNDSRFPKNDTKTMVSTYVAGFGNQGIRFGLNNYTHADWLRWMDPCTDTDRSINYWSGARYGGGVGLRTTFYDPDIFEWYFQPYVSGVNKNGMALIRTENKTANEIVNYFAKQMAYLGFAFAFNENDAISGIMGENNTVSLPVFDENGITTGEFKTGTDCRDLKNFLWRDDVWERNKYDPYKQSEEIDKGYLNNKSTYYPRYSYHESVYDLTATEFKDFVNDVNGLYLDDLQNGYAQCQLDFKGSNPTDYIIAVHGIPFAPNLLIPTSPSDYIQIGPVVLPNAKGKIVDTSTSVLRNCGTIYVDATYNDFRDYAPYSQYLLYVPMFGIVELDGAEIVGHDLELIIYYDITTMAATACIYRDSITLIKTINGTLGATLPLTAARMGDYQNAIHTLQMGIVQSEIRIATSAATTIGALALAPETGVLSAAGAVSSVSSMINSAMNISNLKYEISHKQPNIATLSSASGAVSQWLSTFRPVLYCRHAKMLPQFNANEYAHTIGYACCINTKLGDMNGYTVATNIDCSGISLTAEEINSIKEAFKVGVYM